MRAGALDDQLVYRKALRKELVKLEKPQGAPPKPVPAKISEVESARASLLAVGAFASYGLGVNDIATSITGVTQAQANVPMLRFNLATDIALAPWRSLRVERGGGSQDPNKLFGRNTNVGFVRVWRGSTRSSAGS